MKTTVRTPTLRISIEPNKVGDVNLNIHTSGGVLVVGAVLTQDEAGAIMFGLEQAAMAAEVAQDRMAA